MPPRTGKSTLPPMRYGGKTGGRPYVVKPPKRGIRQLGGSRSYLKKQRVFPAEGEGSSGPTKAQRRRQRRKHRETGVWA